MRVSSGGAGKVLIISAIMVIDCHAHVYPPSFDARREEIRKADATFAQLYSNPKAKLAAAPDLLRAMEKSKVDVTVVMGLGWTSREVAQEANNYILEAADDNPGLLVGFCSVNPAWGDDAVREVERCAAKGARGIGELHPDTQEFDIGSAKQMTPLMDAAKRLGLITLVHSSEPAGHQYPGKGKTTPDKLWAFIQNFPDNVIVCAHWGGGLPFYGLMPEVERGLANVYFDTAASPLIYQPAVFESVADILGAKRILLGTDYPLLPQRRLLNQVAESNLTTAQKESILGGNAKELLGLA